MLLRLVDSYDYAMSEKALRKSHINGVIDIYYGFDNYRDNLEHVLEIKKEILKDYPDMKDKDMYIRTIGEESWTHAGILTILVSVPLKDFFWWRRTGKIKSI